MTYVSDAHTAMRAQQPLKSIQDRQLHSLALLFDLSALMAAYYLSLVLSPYIVRFFQFIPDDIYPGKTHLIIYSCLSLAVLCFLSLRGHYSSRVPWWSQVQHVIKIMLLAALVDGFIRLSFGLNYPVVLVAANWLTSFAMIILARRGINYIKRRSKKWNVHAAIVADADTATDTLYALESDQGVGLTARTLLLHGSKKDQLDREELPDIYKNINVRSDEDDHENYIVSHPGLFYIVSLEGLNGARRDQLIRIFHQNHIAFALMPAISGINIYEAEAHYFFGNDIMLLNARRPAALIGKFAKRLFDIAGAAAALAVFFIPMLVITLVMKLEGQRGFPFYGGKRVGRDGRLFRCWKFETMGPDSPETDKILADYLAANPEARAYWNRYFKLPDDPRIKTRTARFIRKASIDELPQLWNVLKGEMSLVGPRPILPSEVEAYGDRYEEYISAKPGITGLWQVSGRNKTSFQRRVIWDSWYVRNWTLWGDLVILLKTIQTVFSRSGAS